jgi:predicted ester cyclase
MRKGFPDLHYEIMDLVVTENKAVARTIVRGTHLGELWGLKPTGRRFEISQINIEHLKNGKIVEHWRVSDEIGLMKQLGFI